MGQERFEAQLRGVSGYSFSRIFGVENETLHKLVSPTLSADKKTAIQSEHFLLGNWSATHHLKKSYHAPLHQSHVKARNKSTHKRHASRCYSRFRCVFWTRCSDKAFISENWFNLNIMGGGGGVHFCLKKPTDQPVFEPAASHLLVWVEAHIALTSSETDGCLAKTTWTHPACRGTLWLLCSTPDGTYLKGSALIWASCCWHAVLTLISMAENGTLAVRAEEYSVLWFMKYYFNIQLTQISGSLTYSSLTSFLFFHELQDKGHLLIQHIARSNCQGPILCRWWIDWKNMQTVTAFKTPLYCENADSSPLYEFLQTKWWSWGSDTAPCARRLAAYLNSFILSVFV